MNGIKIAVALRRNFSGRKMMNASRAIADALSPDGKEQLREQLPSRERTGVKTNLPRIH